MRAGVDETTLWAVSENAGTRSEEAMPIRIHTTMPLPRESRVLVVVRWLSTVVLALYAIFGLISAYRAWVQVKSLDLRTSGQELQRGSSITVLAVSWARTTVTVRVELIQDGRSDTLQICRIQSNHVASLDPRTRSAWLYVVLGREQLERFHAGRATIRASAIGGPQWLRTPPPLVRTHPGGDRRRVRARDARHNEWPRACVIDPSIGSTRAPQMSSRARPTSDLSDAVIAPSNRSARCLH